MDHRVMVLVGLVAVAACANEAPSAEELEADKAEAAAERQASFDARRAMYGVHWVCQCSGFLNGQPDMMATTICAASRAAALADAQAMVDDLPDDFYRYYRCTGCCYEGERLLQKPMCRREVAESCEQSDPTTVRCPSPDDVACDPR